MCSRHEFCFGYDNPVASMSQSEMIRRSLNQATKPGVSDFIPGSTPLYISTTNGHVEVTKLLLENGADVNTWGERFVTP